MEFSLAHPDMVDKLVVVDIAPKVYPGGHQEIFEALQSVNLAQVKERSEVYEQLKERIDDYGVLQFLLKNLSRNKKGGYEWKMNLPVLFSNYQNMLDAIESNGLFDGPALFIRGDKSNYILEEDFPLLEALFPNASVETISGAGHWVHAERPEELLKLIRAFLEE